jgi:hypothetical protein
MPPCVTTFRVTGTWRKVGARLSQIPPFTPSPAISTMPTAGSKEASSASASISGAAARSSRQTSTRHNRGGLTRSWGRQPSQNRRPRRQLDRLLRERLRAKVLAKGSPAEGPCVAGVGRLRELLQAVSRAEADKQGADGVWTSVPGDLCDLFPCRRRRLCHARNGAISRSRSQLSFGVQFPHGNAPRPLGPRTQAKCRRPPIVSRGFPYVRPARSYLPVASRAVSHDT